MEKTLKKIDRNYQFVLEGLDDLKSLTGEDSPIVDQILFYLFEMHMLIKKSGQEDGSNYEALVNIFKENIESTISNFLEYKNDDSLRLYRSLEVDSLEGWEKVIKTFPLFVEVMKYFKFKDDIKIDITNEFIVCSGDVLGVKLRGTDKSSVYKLTRKLMNKRSWLTYDVSEGNTKGYFKLSLKLNNTDKNDQLLAFKFDKVKGVEKPILCLSNSVEEYITSPQKIYEMGRHVCYEVTECLTLKEHSQIPRRIVENVRDGISSKCILHFPFLFHPLSLIIPNRGRIMTFRAPIEQNKDYDQFNAKLEVSNSEDYENDSESSSEISKEDKLYYINLFSLINN